MTDERAFLMAILQRPDDDVTKLVYADWLEEQGDPRGEFLRLMVQLRRERLISPEQRQRHQELSAELAELRSLMLEAWRSERGSSPENHERERQEQKLERQLIRLSEQIRQRVPARLQELAASLDPNWLAVVSAPEIEGCGKSTGRAW